VSANDYPEATAAYVDSLLECTGQLTVLLDHMTRHEVNPRARRRGSH
jgi:hypothetical protein